MSEQLQEPEGSGIASAILRTYTALNRLAIAEGLTSPYRIWLLCRSLDSDGRGIVSLSALKAAMQAEGLGRRILTRASQLPRSCIFFTLHPNKIEYRSLEAVCVGLETVPGRSVYIPRACISNMESFRAQLYTAWIGGQQSLFISREKLETLFGVSSDTQRRWERLTGVCVTYNIVEVAPEHEATAANYLPQDARLDERLGQHYTWEYDGKTYYRTVNRYEALHCERARTGNLRKVARAVKRTLPVETHGDGTESAPHHRVFFDQRTTPANHQHVKGASLRHTDQTVTTERGDSNLWQFSPWRPTARRTMLD